ncbi:MAG: glycoside hydrolase family 99-like domain-containing protein [Candidatus Omnitrophica bacterium]|nr:glycoside hydrolase family 99-like domain-containing protein [Candidatus Omnitrophota bacterium]
MFKSFIGFSVITCAILTAEGGAERKGDEMHPQDRAYTVAAYYFPSYHPDPRRERQYGAGWTEWELVKQARPRFENHAQPKVPAWGYEDESDPAVMAKKIDAAADHGIDAFLFDWYWYDGPFLERGLERGFLEAENNNRLKFGLMWANHDWTDIFPRTLARSPELLYPGKVSSATFEAATDYIIEKYFRHPSYWRIKERPYFSFYDLSALVGSFGGLRETREALERFREKTVKAGFPGLHLNIVMWGQTVLPNAEVAPNPAELVKELGFDSVTSYVWVHHVALSEFPSMPYQHVFIEYLKYAREAVNLYSVPYYPNVTVGWDSTPRTDQSGPFIKAGYPYTPVLVGNTPTAFQEALQSIRDFLDTRPSDERIVTLNCWNEWTEGSYLEPDAKNGMKYLEAVRTVFP